MTPVTENTLFYGDNLPILPPDVTAEILAASDNITGPVKDVWLN